LAWWHYALAVWVILIAFSIDLVPNVFEMLDLRKKRGLSEYDPKQFSEGAADTTDDESKKGDGRG
jgi:hypothetical protein